MIWYQFQRILSRAIQLFVPMIKQRIYKNTTIRVHGRASFLYKKMHRTYQKYHSTKIFGYFEKYKNIKKLYRKSLLNEKRKTEYNILNSNNPKAFYSYIKNYLNPTKPSSISLSNNNVETSDPKIVGELFNKYFSSVYNDLSGDRLDMKINANFSHEILDENIVNKAILNINDSMSVGPNEIPSIFWKNLSNVLCPFICILFNKFLNEGYFPEIWKISKLKPLYKGTGSKTDTNNYRPIALTCVICKIFEKSISLVISDNINERLNNAQHGFRRKRSTLSNLLSFYNMLFLKRNESKTIDIISFDLSKAFDKLSHDILLKKLSQFVTDLRIIKFFENF